MEDKEIDMEDLHMECLTEEKGNVEMAWVGWGWDGNRGAMTAPFILEVEEKDGLIEQG